VCTHGNPPRTFFDRQRAFAIKNDEDVETKFHPPSGVCWARNHVGPRWGSQRRRWPACRTNAKLFFCSIIFKAEETFAQVTNHRRGLIRSAMACDCPLNKLTSEVKEHSRGRTPKNGHTLSSAILAPVISNWRPFEKLAGRVSWGDFFIPCPPVLPPVLFPARGNDGPRTSPSKKGESETTPFVVARSAFRSIKSRLTLADSCPIVAWTKLGLRRRSPILLGRLVGRFHNHLISVRKPAPQVAPPPRGVG